MKLIRDKILDWWSIGHLIFGIIVSLILKVLGLPLIVAILFSLFIFTVWEIVEPKIFKYFIKQEFGENNANRIGDILVGLIGFLCYWWVF